MTEPEYWSAKDIAENMGNHVETARRLTRDRRHPEPVQVFRAGRMRRAWNADDVRAFYATRGKSAHGIRYNMTRGESAKAHPEGANAFAEWAGIAGAVDWVDPRYDVHTSDGKTTEVTLSVRISIPIREYAEIQRERHGYIE